MTRDEYDRASRGIAERLRLLESAIVNANDAVLITDAQVEEPGPRIVYCNAAFTTTTGYTEAEILGKSPRFLQLPGTSRDELDKIRQAIQDGTSVSVELLNRKKNGCEFWVEISIVPVVDGAGLCTHYVSIQREITKRKEAEALDAAMREAETLRLAAQADMRLLEAELARGKVYLAELSHAATHDNLTQLRNRSFFIQVLQETISELGQRPDPSFAVLFIDLDRFKIVNDSLGHAAGDQLLEEVAYRLKVCTTSEMTLARLGGDEFAILVRGGDDASSGTTLAARIMEVMKTPVWLGTQEVFCTCSIGVVQSTHDYVSTAEVLRDADIAMYHSKRRERGGFALYTSDMQTAAMETLRLHTDLKNAVLRNEFFLEYQPIFHAISGHIVGVEALIRWRHISQGVVSPAAFIPVAEETGLIIEIGKWVLHEACRQLSEWLAKVPAHPLFLSVNISGLQLKDAGFTDYLQKLLRNYELSPHRLQLEITESVFIEDLESASSLVRRIREQGVTVALDDFGTGYSSLSYLTRYEFDVIKIDRSFVEQMFNEPRASALVEAIVRIGCAMGMKIIAEGVEHKAQLTALRQMTCDYIQGYLLSRPVSAADIQFALEQGTRRR